MELSKGFESVVSNVKELLGEDLLSLRLFTNDGILLYSDSKGSINEDFLIASGSAIVEISNTFSKQLGFREEPSILLLGNDAFVLIKRLSRDTVLMMSVKGSYEQLSGKVSSILNKLGDFLK